MKSEFTLKENFNTSPTELYNAWLNSDEHSKMTGGSATASDKVGDNFTAWDGYINGKNMELEPFKKIVQSWRTTEFPDNVEDSVLQIDLNETSNGTELTLTHSNIPEGNADYENGWVEHYFIPMKEYFK